MPHSNDMARANESDQTRQDAQRRVDAIHAFQSELAALEEAGVVTLNEAQRGAIANHHSALITQLTSEFDVGAKQLSLGMRVPRTERGAKHIINSKRLL